MLDRNFILNQCQTSNDINEYLMTIYNLPVQLNAKVIVELGAGESSFALTAAANKTEGEVYSFDLNVKGAVNRYVDTAFDNLRGESRFHPTSGDDMDAVKNWVKPIDFLFFDTSHFYDQTKAEIAAWFPFVRKGGQIFMHDTNHEAGTGMGCRQALNEFLASEQGKQYVAVHLLDTKIIGGTVLVKI